MTKLDYLIKNATIVNEGEIFNGSVGIASGKISFVKKGSPETEPEAVEIVDASGLHLFPGCIDDQVHFREPGLTHKGDLFTESRAAVAGGITSFMEMPNTVPNTLTQELLEEKYQRASQVSLANYSFFMGASNSNLDEVLRTNPLNVCGLKVFMGSSTGNMLVDNEEILDELFRNCSMLIATHCEDEQTIRQNSELAKLKYGDQVPFSQHPVIRSEEACYKSSSKAVELALKHNSRLHILHISTAKECGLFDNSIPLREKRITAEACIHHLWFTDADYQEKGSYIKWNPAVKSEKDRDEIREAVRDNRIDVIATDHAPHSLQEKDNSYFNAPSGGPLVQHALPAMLELHKQGVFSLPLIADKMSHSPALCFQVEKRGFIREGYFADLVLVDLNASWKVASENILYKCGWSPFEGEKFSSTVHSTFVNGHKAYSRGKFYEDTLGSRLTFNR